MRSAFWPSACAAGSVDATCEAIWFTSPKAPGAKPWAWACDNACSMAWLSRGANGVPGVAGVAVAAGPWGAGACEPA